MNQVVIGIGSNIEPEKNIPKALNLLRDCLVVLAESSFVMTEPVGPAGQPNFVNGLVLIHTDDDIERLKRRLRDIEFSLGRRRSGNAYDPREVDLDIMIWNECVVDPNLHRIGFYREALAQIWPSFKF